MPADPRSLSSDTTFEPAESIEEVIDRLHGIVARARGDDDRLGLFASLYLRTTACVFDGIRRGRFEDGRRMERFDVDFANRYLRAYHQHRHGEPTTASWQVAFDRAAEPHHLVLQHLMLGMNAHINFDLGIAACATCPGRELQDLEHDFFEINRILAEMIDVVQHDLNRVSPLLAWVDRLGGRADEMLVQAFLRRSRRAAWTRATRLAPLRGSARRDAVAAYDRFTERLARRICPPPARQPEWLHAVKRRETADLQEIYEVLA